MSYLTYIGENNRMSASFEAGNKQNSIKEKNIYYLFWDENKKVLRETLVEEEASKFELINQKIAELLCYLRPIPTVHSDFHPTLLTYINTATQYLQRKNIDPELKATMENLLERIHKVYAIASLSEKRLIEACRNDDVHKIRSFLKYDHPEYQYLKEHFFDIAFTDNKLKVMKAILEYSIDEEILIPLYISALENKRDAAGLMIAQYMHSPQKLEECLALAVMYSARPDMIKYFLSHGVSVNMIDEIGRPLICIAALNNSLEIIELLLTYKPKIDACVRQGMTALYFSLFKGNIPITMKLLEAGVEPDWKDFNGDTPLQYAVKLRGTFPKLDALYEEKVKQMEMRDAIS